MGGGVAHRCGAGLHTATYYINGTFHNDVDLDYCNYLILWGSNLGFLTEVNALPMARKMAEARARGMKLVVVDPRCSVAAAKADEWIPIRPGTDSAMALVSSIINKFNHLVAFAKICSADFVQMKGLAPLFQ